MSILHVPNPRPKLLTRIEVASILTMNMDFSVLGQYDTEVTFDVPIGDYYMAGDGQADDFLHTFIAAMVAAINAEATLAATFEGVAAAISADGIVSIKFFDTAYSGLSSDVQLNWDEDADTIELARILGFNSAAPSTHTDNYPLATADSPHAYGWYADDIGYIKADPAYMHHVRNVMQSVTPSGHVKTIGYGGHRTSFMELQQLPSELVHSNGAEYGETPSYPLVRNAGLECWFLEVSQGTPFRYYRNGYVHVNSAIDRGVATGGAATRIIDSGKAWVDGQYTGKLVHIPDFFATGVPFISYIANHYATDPTTGFEFVDTYGDATTKSGTSYQVLDCGYETFVLNRAVNKWEPKEPYTGIELYDTQRYQFIAYIG